MSLVKKNSEVLEEPTVCTGKSRPPATFNGILTCFKGGSDGGRKTLVSTPKTDLKGD
jgi:hypothetical protein